MRTTIEHICFLEHTRVHIPDDMSIGSAVLHSSRHRVDPYTLQWAADSPTRQNCAIVRMGDLVFLLHLTFKLIIVFCIFVVGRLDQLNIFFYGLVRVNRVRVQHWG